MGLASARSFGDDEGLAVLLRKSPRHRERLSALETKILAADLEASLRFIFDPVDETSFVTAENGTRQIKYEAIVDRIQRGVECDLETETISGEDNGRLGPRDVVMSVERGSLGIEQGTRVLGRGSFSSCRANVSVFKGRWMYECTLGTGGIIQLGWTTLLSRYTSEEGVGDSNDSYAYDGKRRRKWNVTAAPYGEAWVAGDVIGCCIDLDEGTISYYRNGADQGVAFDYVRRRVPGAAYFPGASVSGGEWCSFNFGASPFRFPVEGYHPLQPPPLPSTLKAASYACGCIFRLVELTTDPPATPSPDPSRPAPSSEQDPAAVPVSPFLEDHGPWSDVTCGSQGWASRVGDEGGACGEETGEWSCEGARHGGSRDGGGGDSAQNSARSNQGRDERDGEGGPGEGSPVCWEQPHARGRNGPEEEGAPVEEEAGAAGQSTSESSGEEGGPSYEGGGCGVGMGSVGKKRMERAVGSDEAVLLASLVVVHLGPLCTSQPYCVCTAVLPMLRRALELGRPYLLGLLGLIEATLEEEELRLLQRALVQELAQEVCTCPWSKSDLPGSNALRALQLWGALLENQRWRRRWLSWHHWMFELEALLTVRQPSTADLAGVFPGVRFVEGRGQQRARFSDDMQLLEDALEQVEEAQLEILLHLWRESGALEVALPTGGRSKPWESFMAPVLGSQDEQQEGDEAGAVSHPSAGLLQQPGVEQGPGTAVPLQPCWGAGGGGQRKDAAGVGAEGHPVPGSSACEDPSTNTSVGGGACAAVSADTPAIRNARATASAEGNAGEGAQGAGGEAEESQGPHGGAGHHPSEPPHGNAAAPGSSGQASCDTPDAGARSEGVPANSTPTESLLNGAEETPAAARPRYDPLGLHTGRAAGTPATALPPKPPALKPLPPTVMVAEGDCVRWFLEWLVQKNRKARVDMPPPGLSDSSVLTSTFFCVLRLLRPTLDQVHILGRSFSFQAGLFLQGLPGHPGTDPYFDLARLGGTLSHLAKAHPPAPADVEAGAALAVQKAIRQMDWNFPFPEGDVSSCADVRWDSWLLDRLLLLHHLGVAVQLRAAFARLQSMESSAVAVQDLTERLRGGQGGNAEESESAEDTVLRRSLRDHQQQLVEGVRHHGWSQARLLSGWKQEATLALAAVVCRLLGALSREGDVLLRYTPELYMESALDMLHAVHRAEPCLDTADGLMYRGANSCLEFLVQHLSESRIANPDVRSMPLQTVWVLLQEEDWLSALPHFPPFMESLVPGLLQLFPQERYWVQVGNVLLLLAQGTGFLRQSPPLKGSAASTGVLGQLRLQLQKTCREGLDAGSGGGPTPLVSAFMNQLFSSASWAATEMVVGLEEVSSARVQQGRGDGVAAASALRRAGVTAELCASLLRLLELVAGLAPELFSCGSSLNLTRLLEVANFILSQLQPGGRAAGGFEQVAEMMRESQRGRLGLSGEGYPSPKQLLQPLAGVLLNLWLAESTWPPPPTAAKLWEPPTSSSGSSASAADAPSLTSAPAAPAGTAEALARPDPALSADTKGACGSSGGRDGVGASGAAAGGGGEHSAEGGASRIECDGGGAAGDAAEREGEDGEATWGGRQDAEGRREAVEEAGLGPAQPCFGSSSGWRPQNSLVAALAGSSGLAPAKLRWLAEFEYGGEGWQQDGQRQLEGLKQLVKAVETRREQLEAERAGRQGGGVGEESGQGARGEADIPGDFLDPILMTVMQDPVILPDSRIVLDRATIERHLLSSKTDPFSRAPLELDQLVPEEDLKRRIWEWEAAGGNLGSPR